VRVLAAVAPRPRGCAPRKRRAFYRSATTPRGWLHDEVLLNEDRNQNRGVRSTSLLFAEKTLLPLAPYRLHGFLNHILGERSDPVHDRNPLLLVNARTSPHRARITRFSELSTFRASPGLNCNSSCIDLGSTIRPALSIVTAVITMAFCHGIWHLLRIWTSFGRAAGHQLLSGCRRICCQAAIACMSGSIVV
jgi:hypothetical protein